MLRALLRFLFPFRPPPKPEPVERKCVVCRQIFTPHDPLHETCGEMCALESMAKPNMAKLQAIYDRGKKRRGAA